MTRTPNLEDLQTRPLLLLAIFLPFLACQGPSGDWLTAPELSASARLLDADTVLSDQYSGIDEDVRRLIDSRSEWEAFWNEAHSGRSPTPETPSIDFDRNVVVAAAMGGASSGGHGIGIEAVARSGDTLYARVRETSPGENCIVTMAITHPVQAVRVPVSDVSVLVTVERTSTRDCD